VRILPLTTGTVRLKHAFLHAATGPTRQARLFAPGRWSPPLPIHAWLVEHDGHRLLVDAGETAGVRDLPFARFAVGPQDELPAALGAHGLTVEDLDEVVLTHLHGDHVDGAVHVAGPVLVHDAELAAAGTRAARALRRVLRQPLPDGLDLRPVALDDGPFGAFAASRRLTDDGRVLAVATPGHTPGHVAVLCVDDDGRHVLLAGDLADTVEQVADRRADAIAPDPALHVETLDRVLRHAREHPTVVLPSHDPGSAARLAARTTL
jgi:N-acyl homoserine lactone hydrolase